MLARLMLSLGLLTALSPFATAQEAASQPVPRRELREATAVRLRAEFGAEPFSLLKAWARGDESETVARFMNARDWPDELDAARREVLLCGLWSSDPEVAFAAACHLPERLMDLRDIDRYVGVTMPHLFDEDLRFEWQTFKHVLSTGQVTQVLAMAPRWQSDASYIYIQDLHRSMRSVHVPQLCALARHHDPVVRKQAWGTLGNLLCYRDDHRDQVAELLLSWPGDRMLAVVDYDDPAANPRFAPRDREPLPDRGGWSPRFRALLDDLFLAPGTGPSETNFQLWLSRWADDEEPAVADVDRLLALLDSPNRFARRIALRSARPVATDPRVAAALRAFEVDPETDPAERAAAWLARDARFEWRAAQLEDDAALLAALAANDQEAWDRFAARAFGSDVAAGIAAVNLLVEARDTALFGPIDWPESAHDQIRAAVDAHAGDLGVRRLVTLAEEFPCCRTAALAAALLAGPCPADLEPWLVGMLEVHDEAALREWLGRAHAAGNEHALEMLSYLGAPAFGKQLIAWAGEDPEHFALLGRSTGSGAVRNQITVLAGMADGERVEPAQAGSFTALAEAAGLPSQVAFSVGARLADLPAELRAEHVDAWVQQLAAGDAVGFLLDFLRVTDPVSAWPLVHGLGSVDDERVRAHLRSLLEDFATGDVQDVILELAIAGDARARGEVREVFERHLYGWMDDAYDDASVLRGDLTLGDYWVGEVGTVCCRRNGAEGALDSLCGYQVQRVGEQSPHTQEWHARAWWQRNAEHLRFSRALGRYVVAPR